MRSQPCLEYVLPLRWGAEQSRRGAAELAGYLATLLEWADVTVVDGSAPELFAHHATLFGPRVQHLPPQPWPGANGKVAGVVTGIRVARHEWVVVADDDVRYDRAALLAVASDLAGADLVRPQNVFTDQSWHARWDTGRTLLNRCLGVDYPGTHAVRRSTFLAMGGYDGDVMFENLELARTVLAHGGVVLDRPDLYVPRLPPTASHFRRQRVRQAFDSLAQPGRLAAELAAGPTLVLLALRAPRLLPAAAGLVVAAAEVGRRRHGGRAVYPAFSALWAVPWVLERSVTSWLALASLARGGVRYGGRRVPRAATSLRTLRRRAALAEEVAALKG